MFADTLHLNNSRDATHRRNSSYKNESDAETTQGIDQKVGTPGLTMPWPHIGD